MPIESVVARRTNRRQNCFTADSDAILTKGLLRFNSDFLQSKASDILEAEMDFIDQIGLKNIYRLPVPTDWFR
jgi:sulfur transfer protein SufE